MTGRVTNMGSKKKESPTWEAADDLFDEFGRRDAKQQTEALARATRTRSPFGMVANSSYVPSSGLLRNISMTALRFERTAVKPFATTSNSGNGDDFPG